MTTDNVIEVRFGNSTLVSISPKYRYDSGWIMKFVDLDLPESYQVHFGNTLDGDTIEAIGDSNGVEIPDILWENGEIIFCWLYLHPTEDSSITKKEVRIAVGNRGKLPTGVTPEPHEQTIIDQLITVMNRSADKAEQNAQEAEASADRSEASATLAEGYLASVRSDAEVARTKAQEAEASAVEAERSETSAQNYAQMSANSAFEAQGYAEDLAESVAEAKGYSESAGISAHNAEVYADQAEIAKTEAISGKEAIISAKNEAVLAKNEAVMAKNEAVLVKTDAESAKTASQTAQGLAESARDTAVSAKNDAESARDDAVQAKEDAESAVASIADALDDKAPIITDTASGSIASFSDGADDLPLKSLVVDINPVQDLSHGDPSPENICPISGWTQVGVEQSGENVGRIYAYSANSLPTPQTTPVASNSYGTTISTTDPQANKIVVTQTRHDGSINVSYRNGFFIVGVDNIINGQRYYFRAKVDVTANPLNTTNLYGLWNGRGNPTPLTIANGYVTGTFVISISDERRYIEIRCAGASFEMSEIMFMLAEDMSVPYSPYTGRSITINLGQTVYGGKLDVLNGELTVYPYYASYNGETLTGEWISDRDKYVSGTTPTIGAQVVNIGAQGVTVQLEPHEVESLYGVNNIWADSGDTEVEYRADTKLFIERLTAPDSADMIADANITSGQYFMVGNSLYKATANIANGSAIVVGTNCIRKSLSEALNEINA